MTSSPKRPWFRFHLLTAVLMMLVVGAFLGVNLLVRDSVFDRSSLFTHEYYVEFERQFARRRSQVLRTEAPAGSVTERSFGWPFVAGGIIESRSQPPVVEYCTPGLIVDAAIAVCALLATIFLSESLLRRREARKP